MRVLYGVRAWLWSLLSWMAWVASGLQGPDISGPTRTNIHYSPFEYQGPNSLSAMGPGPQSVGSFKRLFALMPPRHRRMDPTPRTSFSYKPGRRGPRFLFAESHYKFSGSDGDDHTNPAGQTTSFKFDNPNFESVLSGDMDDDCEGCQTLYSHPCCRLRSPPQRVG